LSLLDIIFNNYGQGLKQAETSIFSPKRKAGGVSTARLENRPNRFASSPVLPFVGLADCRPPAADSRF
jgi:hypothetical protein